MSCVNYWSYCSNKKCGHQEYGRHREDSCVKCGAKCDYHIREWDEEGDHEGTFSWVPGGQDMSDDVEVEHE